MIVEKISLKKWKKWLLLWMMYAKITEQLRNAGVAKLADAPDLGSGGQPWGSSPFTRTIYCKWALKKAFFVLYGNYVVIELRLEPWELLLGKTIK